MDRKQALAILGLSGSASFQDAKAAFRRLAKQHHPDHFARDAVAVILAEKQMKAINQAYHLLASVLPRSVEHASSVRDMPGSGRPSGFADMVMRMKKRFWKRSGRTRPAGPAGAASRPGAAEKAGMSDVSGRTDPSGKAGASGKAGGGADRAERSGRASEFGRTRSARNRPSSGAAGYSRSHAGSFPPKSRPAGPHPSFEQVISPLFGGQGGRAASVRTVTGKRFAATPRTPYAGFVRYMALKNQIQNRKRFQDRNHSTRVEKISRISPVGRVADD